jgi:hypothetical protein
MTNQMSRRELDCYYARDMANLAKLPELAPAPLLSAPLAKHLAGLGVHTMNHLTRATSDRLVGIVIGRKGAA